MTTAKILITGATGQLGALVIDALLKIRKASEIAAIVRPSAGADKASVRHLADAGVETRAADYDDVASLEVAFQGIDRLLFISSSAVGKRVAQHGNVIDSAKRAGVGQVAYTSVLHADRSPLGLAAEHRATETLLHKSGLSYVLLRNGWYTENYLAAAFKAIENGVYLGAAGDARVTTAARADYAAAAAAVMNTAEDWSGRVFELAGDEPYSLIELAAELAKHSGHPVRYENLTQADYEAALLQVGMAAPVAALIADADAGATKGALFDDSHDLSRLIGRPTTSLSKSVADALARALPMQVTARASRHDTASTRRSP